MRKDVIISISFHLAIIVAIILFGPSVQPVKGYPKIYKVGLVSLPPSGGGNEGETKAEANAKMEKTSGKGVAIKELKKNKEKKIASEKKTGSKKESPAQSKTGSSKEDKKQEGSGGSGSGPSSNISAGIVGSAQVDGADFGGDYYVQMFVSRINELWENPIRSASSTLNATVYFKILKNGNIIDAKIEKGSGVAVFDKAALRAVISASPLLPLPSEYTGEYLGVHLEFEFVQ